MKVIVPIFNLDATRQQAWDRVRATIHYPVIVATGSHPWNKSKVLNQAIKDCDDQDILVLDGDILLDWSKVRPAERGEFIRPFNRVYKLTQSVTGGYYAGVPIQDGNYPTIAVNGGGAFIMKKADYIALGGFHEGYEGWGYEDADFGNRLHILKRTVIDAPAYHLWHEESKQNVERNRELFHQRSLMNPRVAVQNTVSCFKHSAIPAHPQTRKAPELVPVESVDLPDLDVLTIAYGYNPRRFQAFENTLRAWDTNQAFMPRVTLAWCYKDRPAPQYPWLDIVHLPEYDLPDCLFRKEGLLNYLLTLTHRPNILTIDADCWSEDPLWFKKINDLISTGVSVQPFHKMTDTEEALVAHSWSSRKRYPKIDCKQPGMGWGFTRAWADSHGDQTVFNPWLITGSGDCAFILEHTRDDGGTWFAQRHRTYRYFRAVERVLPEMTTDAVDCDVWHECHTDQSKVPPAYRGKAYADRAYIYSRAAVDWWGDLKQYVYLDSRGVPMLVDPTGPFGKFLALKPEMQTEADCHRVIAKCFGGK